MKIKIKEKWGTISPLALAQELKIPIIYLLVLCCEENLIPLHWWDLEDIRFLESKYSYLSLRELSHRLYRTEEEIFAKAWTLGLLKDKLGFWPDEVDWLITSRLGGESIKNIAYQLNRTVGSIMLKLRELDLAGGVKQYTDDEILTLKLMSQDNTFTYFDIAQKLNISVEAARAAITYRGWNSGVKKSISVGEEFIKDILQTIGVKHIWTQHKILGNLRLDFFLPEYNLAIEWDGEQHFIMNNFFHTDLNDFQDAQKRDSKKTSYCLNNQITLLRLNNFDTAKKQIEEAISKCNISLDVKPIKRHPGFPKMTPSQKAYKQLQNRILYQKSLQGKK